MKEDLVMQEEAWEFDPAEDAAGAGDRETPDLWEDDALWEDGGSSKSEGEEDWEADQPNRSESSNTDQFLLKYMNEEKTVNREEVVTLAQKGMDYDRVRSRLAEAQRSLQELENRRGDMGLRDEQLRQLEELSHQQGLTLDQLLEDAHARLLAQSTGKTPAECREQVMRLREESRRSAESRNQTQRRRAEDIAAFTKAYPQIADAPHTIPREVWDQVNRGDTLLNAYREHEVRQLRKELEQQKAEARKWQSRERTTGSQLSRGSKWVDPLDAIWYDGE